MSSVTSHAGTAQFNTAGELLIHDGDGRTRRVQLDRDRYELGRSSVNFLCYPDDSGLSRHHLAIYRSPNGWMVEDLGSKNGTLVNGIRVDSARRFAPGDRISAGHLTIEFGQAPTARQTVVFVESAAAEVAAPMDATVVQRLTDVLGAEDSKDLNKTYAMQGSPQMRALIQAGRELVRNRTLEELFKVILDLAVEAVMAGRGVVMTLEGEELVVKAARGDGFRISSVVRDRVLTEKASLLVRDTQLDQALKNRESIVASRVRSMMAVPLQTNEQVIGLIYLDSPHLIREFTREDLNLLTVMANVAAIRIEHARLVEVERQDMIIQKELGQAAEIQRGLLPKTAPNVAGVNLAGFNVPSRAVGGDYYDFFTYPDGRVGLIVADVAGKGLPAALLMTSLRARCHVLFEEASDLMNKVTRLNKAICADTPDNRFITFFIAVLDPATGALTYVNAGHNPPLLVRAAGGVDQLDQGGPVLGILPIARYREVNVQVEPGDSIVFYSDGVTEAASPEGEEFGEDRLGAFVAGRPNLEVAELITEISSAVNTFTKGAPLADDLTLLIARRGV